MTVILETHRVPDLLFGSNLLTMSVTDDGYPREASCARLIIWLQSVDHERN